MLKDGRLGNMLTPWQPWWTQKKSLVEDVSPDKSLTAACAIPTVVKNIPDLSRILKGEPASCIQYSVVSVLYAYVYLARLHNGTHQQLPLETARELLQLTPCLGHVTYDLLPESVHANMHQLQHQASSVFVSVQFTVAALSDLRLLLVSPRSHQMAALSDAHTLCHKGCKQLGRDVKQADVEHATALRSERQTMHAAQKKLEFLLAWTCAHGEQLEALVPFLDLEICEQTSELARVQEDKTRLEMAWGGTRPPNPAREPGELIQELIS